MTHAALAHVDHRPWPLPAARWTWRQTWLDLLFAHWPVPVEAVCPHVPSGLEVQTFAGTAWIGVIPFRMEGVMRRELPDLPGLSAFPEINVRTYVERDGRPGVYFLSLDATNALAVWAARRCFHLPYHRARIDVGRDGDAVTYASVRRAAPPGLTFRARYRPTGPPVAAQPGSLEHFLVERYCLHAAAPGGRLTRTEIHHAPWPIQPASASIERNDMLDPWGIAVEGPPASLLFARRMEVVVWNPVDAAA